MDSDSRETRFAVESVQAAARIARDVQNELVQPALTKDDRSPVTVADFAVQAVIGRMLAQRFPEDPLVGEETAAQLREDAGADTLAQVVAFVRHAFPEALPEEVCTWIDRGRGVPVAQGRFWTLDPVDGTKGFLRGDQYAIALALLVNGEVVIGVLGCPNLTEAHRPEPGGAGTLVVAARGQGAHWTPLFEDGPMTRLEVSDVTAARDARLLRSYESAHTNTGRIGRLVEAMGVEAPPVGMDSQAKYAVLAAGRGDLLFRLLSSKQPDYRERIWDQAAGSLVVQEAGGIITDLSGAPLDFTQGRTLAANRGILASNKHLHEAALKALARVQ